MATLMLELLHRQRRRPGETVDVQPGDPVTATGFGFMNGRVNVDGTNSVKRPGARKPASGRYSDRKRRLDERAPDQRRVHHVVAESPNNALPGRPRRTPRPPPSTAGNPGGRVSASRIPVITTLQSPGVLPLTRQVRKQALGEHRHQRRGDGAPTN